MLNNLTLKIFSIAVGLSIQGSSASAAGAPPIDAIEQIIPVQINECKSRVRNGFSRAGYANIQDIETQNGVKGEMLSGDNAGVSSSVICIFNNNASTIVITSAGGSAAFVPQSQTNRLLSAINNP